MMQITILLEELLLDHSSLQLMVNVPIFIYWYLEAMICIVVLQSLSPWLMHISLWANHTSTHTSQTHKLKVCSLLCKELFVIQTTTSFKQTQLVYPGCTHNTGHEGI
jgi:hypothetical protein